MGGIGELLVYVSLIVCLTIYIHFEKRNSYQKGFSDGVEHYSRLVDEVLHSIDRWNKEQDEITAYVESIKPLNKTESEGKDDQ